MGHTTPPATKALTGYTRRVHAVTNMGQLEDGYFMCLGDNGAMTGAMRGAATGYTGGQQYSSWSDVAWLLRSHERRVHDITNTAQRNEGGTCYGRHTKTQEECVSQTLLILPSQVDWLKSNQSRAKNKRSNIFLEPTKRQHCFCSTGWQLVWVYRRDGSYKSPWVTRWHSRQNSYKTCDGLYKTSLRQIEELDCDRLYLNIGRWTYSQHVGANCLLIQCLLHYWWRRPFHSAVLLLGH